MTPRVLVVDDDKRVPRDLRDLLAPLGFDVHGVDGQGDVLLREAIERAVAVRPHVVVMDLKLREYFQEADRTGLELLKTDVMESAKRILYSAYLDVDTMREAFSGPAHDVVSKTRPPKELIAVVEKAAHQVCASRRFFRTTATAGWSAEQAICALFGDRSTVPASLILDVLSQLFPPNESLALKTLGATGVSPLPLGSRRSVVLEARPTGFEPVLLKLAPRKRIRREVEAYVAHIDGRLRGNFYPHMRAHAEFWEVGAIRYGLLGSSSQIHTFAAWYRSQNDVAAVARPLQHFFCEVWRGYYQRAVPRSGRLISAYDRLLRLSERLAASDDPGAEIRFRELGMSMPHPAHWLRKHDQESAYDGAREVIAHGDLHANNLLTDGDHGWPIDFERSGPAPILCDFVELEQDLVVRVAPIPEHNWQGFYDVVLALVAPGSLNQPLRTGQLHSSRDEGKKICRVVQKLRHLALEVTGPVDMREYYWGLLLHAIAAASMAGEETVQGRRHMLFAAMLCQRLQHWGAPRPALVS